MDCNWPTTRCTPQALGNAAGGEHPRPDRQEGKLSTAGAAFHATEAAISFTTAEGDRVSIHGSRQTGSGFTQLHQGAAGRHLQSNTMAAINGESFSLTVQGDLNEEELADINRLMGKLTTIAGDFFNGERESALAGGLALGELGSISRLQATFLQSSTMVQQSTLQGDSASSLARLASGAAGGSSETTGAFDYHAVLQSQWRQLKEWLEEHPTKPGEVPGDGRGHKQHLPAATRMLDEVRETMNRHPRLSPLVGSFADHTIDRGAERYNALHPGDEEKTRQAARELKGDFNDRFTQWMMS
ncbi:MAG: hypothetical protein U5J62_11715 [Desulfurivibrio sp.]|nr:hypothetical protein [Desulfurivibrio sp.]